jgi:hypothetical protein
MVKDLNPQHEGASSSPYICKLFSHVKLLGKCKVQVLTFANYLAMLSY